MSLIQYARFLIIGGFVGLVSLALRALIGQMLAADNPTYYSMSVIVAYCLGIVLSFALNRRHTFNQRGTSASFSSFTRFVLVALVGATSTWLLALLLRYDTPLGTLLGAYAATASFAVATVLSTLLTYPLNARFVFRGNS